MSLKRGRRVYLLHKGRVVYSGMDPEKAIRLRDRYWPGGQLSNNPPYPNKCSGWQQQEHPADIEQLTIVTLPGNNVFPETVIALCPECLEKWLCGQYGAKGTVINAEESRLPWFLGKWRDIKLGPVHGWWKVDRHKIYLPTAVIGKFIELDKPGDRRLHFAVFWNQHLLIERQPGLAMLHTGSEWVNRIIWKLCGCD